MFVFCLNTVLKHINHVLFIQNQWEIIMLEKSMTDNWIINNNRRNENAQNNWQPLSCHVWLST
jgi:hypothetical protein